MSTVSSLEGGVRKPKGAVLFTGPDGIGDLRTTVAEQRYIGHGSTSPESSSDTQYLYRAAPTCLHPPPKTARVGEVGWGVPGLSDNTLLKSGNQIKWFYYSHIKLKEFRQAVEDRHTHLYQNPYYPPPPCHSTHPQPPAVIETATSEEKTLNTEEQSVHSNSTDTVAGSYTVTTSINTQADHRDYTAI